MGRTQVTLEINADLQYVHLKKKRYVLILSVGCLTRKSSSGSSTAVVVKDNPFVSHNDGKNICIYEQRFNYRKEDTM